MRLSYQWLCDYVDIRDVSPEALADKLTSVGLEVEGVEPRNHGVSGVVVGLVLECEKHPNADKLRVCQVDVGRGEAYTIVCGAPNVKAGQKVPVALPGSNLPGGPIGKAKLRGVESNGMLCSAKEIGLETKLLPKEQTEGLYILPADAPVGADVVSYLQLDDVIIEIGLTPNRADCLSLRGLAYEVAAVYNRQVRFPEAVSPAPANSGQTAVSVRIETERCSAYWAQALEGLSDAESPIWMQMRLMAMGVRPISLIVDITNYVMLEWGQPLHAFDLDRVHQQTILVRQGRANETLVTLDGEERSLDEDTIVIADVDRAIGIAGVMGGENSEIHADTRRIVVESAAFEATSVRRTGQRLGLRSEAQQRFEKGIDAAAIEGALTRATELLQQLGGATVLGAPVVAGTGHVSQPRTIEFSPSRCNQLLGTQIYSDVMKDIFVRLGFQVVESEEDKWQVEVPTRRPDISLQADLTEEVGRIFGLDAIPTTLPTTGTTVGVRNASQRLRKRTRDAMLGAGLTEVFTYTFSHSSWLDAMRVPQDSPYRQMIPLLRPMSEERVALRTHMLPGLAQVAAYNLAHGVAGGRIFEIGRVYWPKALPLAEQPDERTQLAGLWFGENEPDLGEKARNYDFFDVKGVVQAWLDGLGLGSRVSYQPSTAVWLHPGRSTDVYFLGERIGTLGEVHPETANAWDIGRTIYAEFDLDVVVGHVSDRWRVDSLPKFPSSRRDLAVLVSRQVPAGDLISSAKDATENLGILEDIAVFDVYTGTGVPEGSKSVAISVIYRAGDRTLTDNEIDAAQQAILDLWETKFQARLRA